MLNPDYRQTLRRILVERCQRNPQYSLRAMARDLDFEPARLSDVLNGKKGLSRSSALHLAARLGLAPQETEIFCDQVEALHARSQAQKLMAQERLKSHSHERTQTLSLDIFRVVSDWHHFAILQLLKLPNGPKSNQGLARAFGLQEAVVQESLERLARLELIVEGPQGHLVPSHDSVIAPDEIPSDAVKKFHEQILNKAVTALYTRPCEERDFLTTFMPLDAQDMPILKKKIRAFKEKVLAEFSNKTTVDSVYSISIQCINLTPHLKENKA